MQHKPFAAFLPEFNIIKFSKEALNYSPNCRCRDEKQRFYQSVLLCLLATRRVSSRMLSFELTMNLPGSNCGLIFLFIDQLFTKHLIYVWQCSRHWGYNRTQKNCYPHSAYIIMGETDYNQVSEYEIIKWEVDV